LSISQSKNLKNKASKCRESVVKLYFEFDIRSEKTIKNAKISLKIAFIRVFEILERHFF